MNAFFKTLNHDFFTDKNGFKTSYFFSKNSKPTAVFLHGFGGNAYGLSFLARELSQDFQIILLEMPNHGHSDLINFQNLSEYQNWLRQILTQIEADFGQISLLIGHSMGCYIVADEQISAQIPTILLTPVFETSALYNFFAKITIKLPLFSVFQNFPLFSPFKGLAILRIFSLEALKNMLDNTLNSCIISPKRLILQSKMAKIPLQKSLLSESSKNIFLVIEGSKDGMSLPISRENRQKFFPRAKFKNLHGGHILPIENPKLVAKKIRKALKTMQ